MNNCTAMPTTLSDVLRECSVSVSNIKEMVNNLNSHLFGETAVGENQGEPTCFAEEMENLLSDIKTIQAAMDRTLSRW